MRWYLHNWINISFHYPGQGASLCFIAMPNYRWKFYLYFVLNHLKARFPLRKINTKDEAKHSLKHLKFSKCCPVIEDLLQYFFKNPTSALVTIKVLSLDLLGQGSIGGRICTCHCAFLKWAGQMPALKNIYALDKIKLRELGMIG